jgi:hypothetical protein
MSALFLFVVLVLAAAGLFVSGAYLLAGAGAALLTAGACVATAAVVLQKGLRHGG